MRGVHDGRWDRRPRRVVQRVAVGGATLGAMCRCRVGSVASVLLCVTVVAPPLVRAWAWSVAALVRGRLTAVGALWCARRGAG
jgi:hypothetical protein